MNKLKLVLSLVLLSIVFSCKKEKEAAPATSTAIDNLTGGTTKNWLLSKELIAGVDLGLDDCEKDDVYTFVKATNKVNHTIGKLKCDDEIDSSVAFALSADGKTITIDGEKSDVTELTATKLTLSMTVPIFGKITTIYTAK
jgi:Lipocalin-like domain